MILNNYVNQLVIALFSRNLVDTDKNLYSFRMLAHPTIVVCAIYGIAVDDSCIVHYSLLRGFAGHSLGPILFSS